MAEQVTKHGYYWNYHDEVIIVGAKVFTYDSRNKVTISYDISSSTSGGQTTGTVTLTNVADVHMQGVKEGCPITVKSGCPDLYGQLIKGKITKFSKGKDGANHIATISIIENGSKSNAIDKTQAKKLHKSFEKNTKAKTIISYLKGAGMLNITRLKLKNNKNYQKGYTVNSQPIPTLKKIVSDCDSVIYFRNGAIIIDDNSSSNPFSEHLYLDYGAGLLAEPASQDGATNNSKKKNVTKQWTIEAMEDVRINAGSAVYIAPLNKLCRVQNAHHTHSEDGYKMELVVS